MSDVGLYRVRVCVEGVVPNKSVMNVTDMNICAVKILAVVNPRIRESLFAYDDVRGQ